MLPLALAPSAGKLESRLPSSQVIFWYKMEKVHWKSFGLKPTSLTSPGAVTWGLLHRRLSLLWPCLAVFKQKTYPRERLGTTVHQALRAVKPRLVKSSLQVLWATWSNARGNISDNLFSSTFLLAASHSPQQDGWCQCQFWVPNSSFMHNWVPNALEMMMQGFSPRR